MILTLYLVPAEAGVLCGKLPGIPPFFKRFALRPVQLSPLPSLRSLKRTTGPRLQVFHLAQLMLHPAAIAPISRRPPGDHATPTAQGEGKPGQGARAGPPRLLRQKVIEGGEPPRRARAPRSWCLVVTIDVVPLRLRRFLGQ